MAAQGIKTIFSAYTHASYYSITGKQHLVTLSKTTQIKTLMMFPVPFEIIANHHSTIKPRTIIGFRNLK